MTSEYHKRIFTSPAHVYWAITDRCNLSCLHCLERASSELGRQDLSTADCLKLAGELADNKVFRATITGGEPLLRKDLETIIKVLRGRRVDVKLDSNGILLTNERAKRLQEVGLKDILISLDGSRPETHDFIRGKGSYWKAIQGIKTAVKSGLRTVTSATIMKTNIDDLADIARISHLLDVDNIIISPLMLNGRALMYFSTLGLDYGDYTRLADVRKEVTGEFGDFVRWFDTPVASIALPDEALNDATQKADPSAGRFFVCGAGSRFASIEADGELVPCFNLNIPCGNVKEQSFIDIWQKSPKLKELREIVGIPTEDANPLCKRCKWNVVCGGGCRGETYSIFKNVFAPPLICYLTKENLT